MVSAFRFRQAARDLVVLGRARVVIFCLLGLLATSAVGCGSKFSVPDGELVYTVPRGRLVISFTERGNVKAATSVPIFSQVEGRTTIVKLVPEGTNVEKGDVVVELDSSELTQKLNEQEIAVESATAALLQAQEETKIQKSLSDSEVREAEVRLQQAELDLKKYLEGDYPLALAKAESEVTISEEELTRAQNQYEWSQKLAEKGYVTGTELIADKLSVRKTELKRDEAKHSLAVLKIWQYEKELTTYKFEVEQSTEALERAKRKRAAELAKVESTEKSNEKTLILNQGRLRKLRDQLEKTVIAAPEAGMVVYHTERWNRDRPMEEGAEVRENQRIMHLPDISTMAVELQVHESWIDQVEVGLPALISVDALPNLNMKGEITKVGILPDQVNRWLNPDLKVYLTTVTVDASEDVGLIRPGMSAKVQVIVTTLHDVLYVPVQSVSTSQRKRVCFVLEGGEFRAQRVEIGRYNDSFIEIVSGLDEGMIIQLNPPPSEETAEEEVDLDDGVLANDGKGGGESKRDGKRRQRGGERKRRPEDDRTQENAKPAPASYRKGKGEAQPKSGKTADRATGDA